MRQNILIISFNNIGQSFWNKQLMAESTIISISKTPETIASLLKKHNPEIIIVDTYFTKSNDSNVLTCFKELEKSVTEKIVFHFSPKFSTTEKITTSLKGVFQSVLSTNSINHINQLVSPNYINDLTA